MAGIGPTVTSGGAPRKRPFWRGLALLPLALALGGCPAYVNQIVGGTAVTTIWGGGTPSHEIQQTYYVGVFDPQEQLPPQFYRLRVHGQASGLSNMKFASGWVPASVVDSLGGSIGYAKSNGGGLGALTAANPTGDFGTGTFNPGRRLMMFGPEGFREAPANHRLVVIMGADPSKFFQAVDSTLGQVAGLIEERRNSTLALDLLRAKAALSREYARLKDLETDQGT